MTSTAATRIDAQDCAPARWDDPARGTLAWRMLFSAETTPTEALVCGIAEMQAGETFALHRHVEPEVYFGVEGTGDVLIDGVAHRLAPGVALYIPSMAEHGVPVATQPLRWFYAFARDRFDEITYHFTHEGPVPGQRPE
jgi:mannose-6-phosphate isomerase-like protein (cupin superfamily)